MQLLSRHRKFQLIAPVVVLSVLHLQGCGQARLGAVVDADAELIDLANGDVVHTTTTSNLEDLQNSLPPEQFAALTDAQKLNWVGTIDLRDASFQIDHWYAVRVCGGRDIDVNNDQAITDPGMEVQGCFYGIGDQEDWAQPSYKVSVLSQLLAAPYVEAALANSPGARQDLGPQGNSTAIANFLDAHAQRLLNADLNSDAVIDRQDILNWNPALHSNAQTVPLDTLNQWQDRVRNGEDIGPQLLGYGATLNRSIAVDAGQGVSGDPVLSLQVASSGTYEFFGYSLDTDLALQLLDDSGNLVAQDEDSWVGPNPVISVQLSPGNYELQFALPALTDPAQIYGYIYRDGAALTDAQLTVLSPNLNSGFFGATTSLVDLDNRAVESLGSTSGAGSLDLEELGALSSSGFFLAQLCQGNRLDADLNGSAEAVSGAGCLFSLFGNSDLRWGVVSANTLTTLAAYSLFRDNIDTDWGRSAIDADEINTLVSGLDSQTISQRLDQFAQRVLTSDVDGNGTINYDDILFWDELLDSDAASLSNQEVAAILGKIANGESVWGDAMKIMASAWSTLSNSAGQETNSENSLRVQFDVSSTANYRFVIRSADMTPFGYLLDADGNTITSSGSVSGSTEILEQSLSAGTYTFVATSATAGQNGDIFLEVSRGDELLAPSVFSDAPVTEEPVATGHVVDVLLMYNSGAAASYADIQARIEHVLLSANQVFSASEVPIYLNAVGIEAAPSALNGSLGEALLQGTAENTTVQARRDALKADLVMLFTGNGGNLCGIGYLPPDFGDGVFRTVGTYYGFTAMDASCDGDTLAHEAGHNLGLTHSRRQDGSGWIKDYGTGYGIDGQFVTVMAYSSAFGFVPTVSRFSDPETSCGSQACGVAIGDSQSAHAAQALEEVAPTAAAYYVSGNESDWPQDL